MSHYPRLLLALFLVLAFAQRTFARHQATGSPPPFSNADDSDHDTDEDEEAQAEQSDPEAEWGAFVADDREELSNLELFIEAVIVERADLVSYVLGAIDLPRFAGLREELLLPQNRVRILENAIGADEIVPLLIDFGIVLPDDDEDGHAHLQNLVQQELLHPVVQGDEANGTQVDEYRDAVQASAAALGVNLFGVGQQGSF